VWTPGFYERKNTSFFAECQNMSPCFFFSASKMVINGDRIMMKELDKSLSGKSDEREVK
jgi:hypothetical protein